MIKMKEISNVSALYYVPCLYISFHKEKSFLFRQYEKKLLLLVERVRATRLM